MKNSRHFKFLQGLRQLFCPLTFSSQIKTKKETKLSESLVGMGVGQRERESHEKHKLHAVSNPGGPVRRKIKDGSMNLWDGFWGRAVVKAKSEKGNLSPEQEWNLRKYLRSSLVLSRKKAGKGEEHIRNYKILLL